MKKNFQRIEEIILEAAFFANKAKNGLHYNFDENTIFSLIYTGQLISLLKSDLSLAPHLILRGIWEEEVTLKIEEILLKNKPITIFDVGANFGWYGLVLSRFNSESNIHFFEANPNLIKNLENTMRLNNLVRRSKINNLIISDDNDGFKELHVPNKMQGSASVDRNKLQNNLEYFYEDDKNNLESFSIETKTLDRYSSENNIKQVDFIKIDVEGHEENVLLGSKNLIRLSRELVVLMEWNIGSYSNNLINCLELFDFVYYISEDGNLKDIKDIVDKFSHINQMEQAIIGRTRTNDTFFNCLLSKRKLI